MRVSIRCLEKFSCRPIATSIRKWIGGELLYWLGCSQRGQVQGSFVWNISNHFQRVMRISLAWNSLSLLFLSPVTIYPLACIFHKGGTNQLLSFSPEPCLQQPFVCTEGMETGIRRLIPLEEVASLRVTTVRFALEKQEKTDIGRRHGSKAIARRSSRRKFRDETTFWTFVSRCLFKLSREIVYQNFNTWPPVSFHVYFTRLRNAFNAV